MAELKSINKPVTATYIAQTGHLTEVVVNADQRTPLDGKVYRLLRPEENAGYGISAKSKFSNVTAAHHVAWGSRAKHIPSQYISTCRYLHDAQSLSSKNRWLNGDIVSINVDNAPVTVIHVWDAEVRRKLNFEQRVADPETIDNFKTFAEYFNEILLIGDVPANCMKIEISKQFLPNYFGKIACFI